MTFPEDTQLLAEFLDREAVAVLSLLDSPVQFGFHFGRTGA
jgi:hypothetical protein